VMKISEQAGEMSIPAQEEKVSEIYVILTDDNGNSSANRRVITKGATISDLFFQEMGKNANPAKYLVRVNREHITIDHRLQPGDRVTVTSVKFPLWDLETGSSV